MLKILSHLRTSFLTPQTPLPLPTSSDVTEKTYRDCSQREHTHLVYQHQTPLYELLKKYLDDNLQKILNCLDYRLELDFARINQTLKCNLKKAMSHVKEGEDYLFQLSMNREPRSQATDEKPENEMGIATTMGRRSSMDDAYLIDTLESTELGKTLKIIGVFDGHGGAECAQHARQHFSHHLQKQIEELSKTLSGHPFDVILYNALNFAFVDTSRTFHKPVGGTTANVCIFFDREIWIANTGDSRACLVTHNQVIQLSEDQKPRMLQHKEMIESRGAYVDDMKNVVRHPDAISYIAPARSLGDHQMRGGMCPLPEITKWSLSKHMKYCYLIQGSDGVFNVASTKQVGTLVQRYKDFSPSRIALEIVETACRTHTQDNCTLLVTPIL